MDRFTRNYLITLSLIGIIVAAWWLAGRNFRATEINEILAADPVIAAYAYPFRVISLQDGIATLSSPRSFEFPVLRFLGVIDPQLAGKPQTDARVVAAQQQLVEVQKHAKELVRTQADVSRIAWQLDRDWLRERGIELH